MPWKPPIEVMIQPASGPPSTPAIADADMNVPNALARRCEGYQ
jgi:hypothetical protein